MKNVRRRNAGHADSEALEVDGQSDAKQLVQQLAKDICNIVFMDVDIPGLTAIEVANILKAAYPEINVLLFSVHEDGRSLANVAQQVNSGEPHISLSRLVSQIYEGVMQTNVTAVQKVLAFFNRKSTPQLSQYGLSPRELQVLDCLVNGDTYKRIAERCHISVGTVRSHIMNIYRKLDVNSRSGAIVKAMQERLVAKGEE